MKIVIEIPEGDGYDFIVEQLRWMEMDRRAEGGYLTLDGNNCAMPVQIVGIMEERTEENLGTFTVIKTLDE